MAAPRPELAQARTHGQRNGGRGRGMGKPRPFRERCAVPGTGSGEVGGRGRGIAGIRARGKQALESGELVAGQTGKDQFPCL
jgi:hypothetical protein